MDDVVQSKPAVKSWVAGVNVVGFVLIALVAVTTPEFEQTLLSLVGLLNALGLVVDKAEVLAALSERLFSAGVLPYYLHQLDRVQGGAHFEVDAASTRDLYQKLLAMLPGYLVPKLVREIAGRAAKIPITG